MLCKAAVRCNPPELFKDVQVTTAKPLHASAEPGGPVCYVGRHGNQPGPGMFPGGRTAPRSFTSSKKKGENLIFSSAPLHVLLSASPRPNTGTPTPSFSAGQSGSLNLHFSTFLQRRKLNKPQRNLQKPCVLRRSEDLPGCFRKSASQSRDLGAQRMMYGGGACARRRGGPRWCRLAGGANASA